MDMVNQLIATEADHSLVKKLTYYQSILPPLILFCGDKPSQEQKCFAVGNLSKFEPIPLNNVWAVTALTPFIRVRSVPKTRLIRYYVLSSILQIHESRL